MTEIYGTKNLEKKLLLLVEDNPDDELLAIRALKKNALPCDVKVVRDGQEAVDFLFSQGQFASESHALPDIILLDLKLPKLDGIEVLKQIRANKATCTIPVVMLTSSNEEKDIYNSYNYGVNSFICKPVDFDQFLDVTKQLGNYWLSLNITPLSSANA